MERIKIVDNVLVDKEEYFPPIIIFSDEKEEDVEMFLNNLNWVMNTFEAYRREQKSSSIRQINAMRIIFDLQDEIKRLESEVELLKFEKKHYFEKKPFESKHFSQSGPIAEALKKIAEIPYKERYVCSDPDKYFKNRGVNCD